MNKILVVGSLNMDMVVCTPRVPALGETILGSGFMTVPGGKGANQAVAAARLGGNVTMVGCVGDDIFGQDLIRNLQANGIRTDHVMPLKDCSTGIAMIVVKDGNNFIIVDSGANARLGADDMEKLEDLIAACAIVVIQLEIPLATVEATVKIARKHGVKVLLNPAPAARLSDELLSLVDILTPNESECEIITGMPVKSIDDAGSAIKHLNGRGVKTVIVTMGGKGVVYNNGEAIIHRPVPDVKVVDTTAAGDSFTGAVAYCLVNGKSLDEAIDFANIVGTLTVTKRGAQSSLPTLAEVEAFSV